VSCLLRIPLVVVIDDVLRRKFTVLTWLIDSHGLKGDIIFSHESLAREPHLLL